MNLQADAQAITKASKSNLALAFFALPKARRRDITTFYAWCRIIDDIADDPSVPGLERRAALDLWKGALAAPVPGEAPLAAPVRAVIAAHELDIQNFLEIIAGVEMDLAGATYATWDELRVYCYRVASAVGLVSIGIFGCRSLGAREYAIELGLALQLTNILRDVGEDWRNGQRIYLPAEDLQRFGYNTADLAAGRHTEAFRELMSYEAARAREFYARAAAARPKEDRQALIAAEIMMTIYQRLLERMETDGFRVLDRRYRLNRVEKLRAIAGTMLRVKFL